jgi:hypothetical protein
MPDTDVVRFQSLRILLHSFHFLDSRRFSFRHAIQRLELPQTHEEESKELIPTVSVLDRMEPSLHLMVGSYPRAHASTGWYSHCSTLINVSYWNSRLHGEYNQGYKGSQWRLLSNQCGVHSSNMSTTTTTTPVLTAVYKDILKKLIVDKPRLS